MKKCIISALIMAGSAMQNFSADQLAQMDPQKLFIMMQQLQEQNQELQKQNTKLRSANRLAQEEKKMSSAVPPAPRESAIPARAPRRRSRVPPPPPPMKTSPMKTSPMKTAPPPPKSSVRLPPLNPFAQVNVVNSTSQLESVLQAVKSIEDKLGSSIFGNYYPISKEAAYVPTKIDGDKYDMSNIKVRMTEVGLNGDPCTPVFRAESQEKVRCGSDRNRPKSIVYWLSNGHHAEFERKLDDNPTGCLKIEGSDYNQWDACRIYDTYYKQCCPGFYNQYLEADVMILENGTWRRTAAKSADTIRRHLQKENKKSDYAISAKTWEQLEKKLSEEKKELKESKDPVKRSKKVRRVEKREAEMDNMCTEIEGDKYRLQSRTLELKNGTYIDEYNEMTNKMKQHKVYGNTPSIYGAVQKKLTLEIERKQEAITQVQGSIAELKDAMGQVKCDLAAWDMLKGLESRYPEAINAKTLTVDLGILAKQGRQKMYLREKENRLLELQQTLKNMQRINNNIRGWMMHKTKLYIRNVSEDSTLDSPPAMIFFDHDTQILLRTNPRDCINKKGDIIAIAKKLDYVNGWARELHIAYAPAYCNYKRANPIKKKDFIAIAGIDLSIGGLSPRSSECSIWTECDQAAVPGKIRERLYKGNDHTPIVYKADEGRKQLYVYFDTTARYGSNLKADSLNNMPNDRQALEDIQKDLINAGRWVIAEFNPRTGNLHGIAFNNHVEKKYYHNKPVGKPCDSIPRSYHFDVENGWKMWEHNADRVNPGIACKAYKYAALEIVTKTDRVVSAPYGTVLKKRKEQGNNKMYMVTNSVKKAINDAQDRLKSKYSIETSELNLLEKHKKENVKSGKHHPSAN